MGNSIERYSSHVNKNEQTGYSEQRQNTVVPTPVQEILMSYRYGFA